MQSVNVFRFLASALLLLALTACGFGDPPTVKVTERPAEGLRSSDLDAAWLASLEQWTREAAAEHLRERYEGNEVPDERRGAGVETDARYWEHAGQRLALVTIAYRGTPVRVLRVTGLRDDSLVTVSCTSPEGAPIDPADTAAPCGKTVSDVFGAAD